VLRRGGLRALATRSRMKRGSKARGLKGPGVAALLTPSSSELGVQEHLRQSVPCGTATCSGLRLKVVFEAWNPRNGSGPYGREAEGEETVEGVRNAGDGTCRVRQTRVKRTLSHESLEGRETPGGEP